MPRFSGFDCVGYEALEFVIATGNLAAAATFTAKIEHGDAADPSDAAEIADALLLGADAEASFDRHDDNSAFRIGYIGGKRYL